MLDAAGDGGVSAGIPHKTCSTPEVVDACFESAYKFSLLHVEISKGLTRIRVLPLHINIPILPPSRALKLLAGCVRWSIPLGVDVGVATIIYNLKTPLEVG